MRARDPNCIFCKIAAGEIPSVLLWNDEEVVAFRDIAPQAPTHILIIPRAHIASTLELTPEHANLVGHLFGVATTLAQREGLASPEAGYRLVINTGESGGQSVAHVHLHLLGGRSMAWPPG